MKTEVGWGENETAGKNIAWICCTQEFPGASNHSPGLAFHFLRIYHSFFFFHFLNVQFFFVVFFNYYYLFTLQYCIGFANINMHPPRVYTCSQSWIPLPPPSPYHPSGSSQCTRPKHPVSWIEPGLAIHFLYDIIHISMPFSQIIPPSPSKQ